jgi:signal peptidase I
VLGTSVYGTLHDQDLLVASKISYKLHAPQRGDIIIFKPPNDDARDFIKRVIAVPGDRLRIDKGTVYINGEVLKEPYLPERWTLNNTWPPDGREVIVPPDHYFVLGDNRNHSSDSRTFGYIDINEILGKAEVRIWPIADAGLLNSHPTLAAAP